MKVQNIVLSLPLALLLVLIASCKSHKTDHDNLTSEELYNHGVTHFEAGDYKKAEEFFEQVFFKNPGDKITSSAEIMHAYSLYKQGEYEEAVDVIDVFLKLHPRHQEIAYMYYLKALCYYVQIADIKLDQSRAKKALAIFDEVIKKYPNSEYTIDAKNKRLLILDHLAAKEISVGRYYLNKQNPIAAINRFQIVQKSYQETKHIAEALYRMVESNLMLGLADEALYYQSLLAREHPQDIWYERSKKLFD